MKSIIVLTLFSICLCNGIINQKFVHQLKKTAKFQVYEPEENPFRDWTREEIRNMLGTISERNVDMDIKIDFELNDEYDFRKAHPECILGVREQGRCGSCWAIGGTQALQNRFCLKTGGHKKLVLAPQDPLSCDLNSRGCHGGLLLNLWMYLTMKGCVDEECLPYSSGSGVVEKCPTKCKNGTPLKKYKTMGYFRWHNAREIKTDVGINGPVETTYTVYSDFMNYKGGIYEHTSGKKEGIHAVTILGYGEENGVKYWICQNSWGPKWGEEGYFRIKMGQCGIDSHAIGGSPKL